MVKNIGWICVKKADHNLMKHFLKEIIKQISPWFNKVNILFRKVKLFLEKSDIFTVFSGLVFSLYLVYVLANSFQYYFSFLIMFLLLVAVFGWFTIKKVLYEIVYQVSKAIKDGKK